MKVVVLILREISHRKMNFLLSVMAVVVAVALFVVFATSGEAYRKETRRIQLGMGQNLRIIPKETAMDTFWAKGFSDYTMPEEYVYKFAALEGYEYTHLTGTLQRSVDLQGRQVILTGILPEVMPPGRNQPPMAFSVERGTAYVGSEVARLFNVEPGRKIDVHGKSLAVFKCLTETGSSDDIRIYGHLHDVQEILGLEGRINEIRALECLCLFESGRTDLDPLTLVQMQLAEILPAAKVLLLQGIADVRQRQRAAMEGYLALIMPLVIIACGIWIGTLAMLNVRQRFEEIGIMRALGYRSKDVAILFLGRSVVIGLLGAVLGFLLGTGVALTFGSSIFQFAAESMGPQFVWLVCSLVAAPLFAAAASFIPAVSAITWDPATSLRRE
jgi:ABC-type lipoprotein release transport system permease subunit